MKEIYKLTATELINEYCLKNLSPVEVMHEILERVAAIPQVNAFVQVDDEGALKEAKVSEQKWMRGEPRGLLEGVPISVKDLVPAKGMPTRRGSKTTDQDSLKEVDADSVASLRKHGAIIFAKTTTSEFGNKIVTESPLTGVTRNAWNIERSSGGSSGGSAVAVALGMGPMSLATDGGGSIRIPSNWNGVFGLKPSGYLVPDDGCDYRGLSNTGPITRSVKDAALMLTVLVNHSRRDWKAVPPSGQDYCEGLEKGITGLKIAFSLDHGMDITVDPVIAESVKQAVKTFSDLGADVVEVPVTPMLSYMENNVHSTQWIVNLDRIIRCVPEKKRGLIDSDCLDLASIMQYFPPTKYVDALAKRYEYANEMHLFFDNYDILITPTFHTQAPGVPGLPKELNTAPPLTSWCNQTMQPAATIPCGFTPDAMPIGLQIIGKRFSDSLVLRASRAYEVARGEFPMPHIPEQPEKKSLFKRLL